MEIRLDVHIKEANEKLEQAIKSTMRDMVVDIAQDAINLSPAVTGNNRRSIAYKVEGMTTGEHPVARQAGDDYAAESQVEGEVGDLNFNEGAVYATSGYGGFLETGTARMQAQPYLKPAMDKNFTEEKAGKLLKKHMGE